MMLPGTQPRRLCRLASTPSRSGVREIVGTILGISPERARGDAALVKDLGATSLDFVELVIAAEDLFDVEISDTEADKLVTVDDLVTLIERGIGKQ